LLFYVSSLLPPDPYWLLDEPVAYVKLVFVIPIIEELVFRGLMQDICWRRLPASNLGPVSLANLVTSIVFVLMHMLYHPVLWAAGVLLPSLTFGYFKDRYQSVLPPTVLHVFYNCGYYTLYGAT